MLLMSMFLSFLLLVIFLIAFLLYFNESNRDSLVRIIYGCSDVYLIMVSYELKVLFELSANGKESYIPHEKLSFKNSSVLDGVNEILKRLVPFSCDIENFPHEVIYEMDGGEYFVSEPRGRFECKGNYTWSRVRRGRAGRHYVVLEGVDERWVPLICSQENLRVLEKMQITT